MGKLRIVRERKDEQNSENDLRGLGNHEILTDSSPFACLSVYSENEIDIESTLSKFELEKFRSDLKNTTHLTTRVQNENEHPIQTIRLLGAGLELLKNNSQLKLHLSQISKLHIRMAEGIQDKAKLKEFEPDGHIQDWHKKPKKFSIEVPCQLSLKRSGIEISTLDKTIDLTDDEISKIFSKLTHSGTQTEKLRKVV